MAIRAGADVGSGWRRRRPSTCPSRSPVYRPPVLTNTPTIGEPPKDWSRPSSDVAYPISTEMPNYPPQARDGGVVLLEVPLNEAGGVTETRGIASTGGFESASREALAKWRFKGASYRARPVPSTAYVLFGFRPPLSSPGQRAMPPTAAVPPFRGRRIRRRRLQTSSRRRPRLSAAAAARFPPASAA